MCLHKKTIIKYIIQGDCIKPQLYCTNCYSFVINYKPKYDSEFFTHSYSGNLESFLSEGTFEEIHEKKLSLNYGLKAIIEHYVWCMCGYEENHNYIFESFINEFKLLEYYFLKNNLQNLNPKEIKNHVNLFHPLLLNKLKNNTNYWTSKFNLKYNIHNSTNYFNI